MKYRKIINKLILMVGVTTTGVLTSCEQEFYQDEQYRKEIAEFNLQMQQNSD